MPDPEEYLFAICNELGDEVCRNLASRVSQGKTSREDFFDYLVRNHSSVEIDTAIKAAQRAKAKEGEEHVNIKGLNISKAYTKVGVKMNPNLGETLAEKELKKAMQAVRQISPSEIPTITLQETKTSQQATSDFKLPAAPSDVIDLCRICVTPATMGILASLAEWYAGTDKEEIKRKADQLQTEEIKVEDVYAWVMTELPGGVDALNRITGDLTRVLFRAMEVAIERKPELKEQLELYMADAETRVEEEK